MKVCLLFFNLGGYHLARIKAAYESCNARGWDFHVIEIARSTSEHPWGSIDVPDYVTTLMPFQPGDAPSLPDMSLLNAQLNSLAPDAVAVPGWGHNFARAALNWCRRNKRIPVLMSESKYDDASRAWWKELAKRILYVRHFSTAVVGGEKHRRYVTRLGMAEDRIFGGYDTVDNQFFIDGVDQLRREPERQIPTCVQGRRYFLAANRFIERKNLEGLLTAFHNFTKAQPAESPWDLVLLGDGPQRARLEAMARELGIANRVHFPGFTTYREICPWYAFADVFVHPAKAEQWGLVVNEAMAAQLPILLSRSCGCFPDLLTDGENGFSFAPDDLEDLTAQMVMLAGDSDLRKEMGRESRRRIVANFGPQQFGGGLVSAIDVALAG